MPSGEYRRWAECRETRMLRSTGGRWFAQCPTLPMEGTKSVLGFYVVEGDENQVSWGAVFQDLIQRGLKRVMLFVTDDFSGVREMIRLGAMHRPNWTVSLGSGVKGSERARELVHSPPRVSLGLDSPLRARRLPTRVLRREPLRGRCPQIGRRTLRSSR